MADLFRSEGKIYVVLAVLGILFVGLAAYLIWMDRRLAKLEQKK
jgi:CcmD family protein